MSVIEGNERGNGPKLQISARVRGMPEALSIYINQLVYDLRRMNRDVITLSLGEAFFQIPLFDFRRLDIEKCYHYSDSQGIPELREKIAGFYRTQYNAPVQAHEIMISAGSKPILFMVMQCILDPGDEVVVHEPAWLSYKEQVRMVEGVARFIRHDCPTERFPDHFTERTRIMILNNPNNPAGRIYTRENLTQLYRECRSRGIYLLVDEAYSDFVADEPFTSLMEVAPDKDGAIVVNSLSKNMGMSGWRVGYAITEPRLLSALLKVNQHIITCAPTILLHYMNTYFDDVIGITLPQVREVVEKRKRVATMMDELGLQRLPGSSTFYFFVSIEDFVGSGMDFALHLLLEHGIATVPGEAYGASTDRFIRVSIGTESEDRIRTALEIIKDLISETDFSAAGYRTRLREMGLLMFQPGSD